MKPETEALIRNVVAFDGEITAPDLDKAIDILRGKVGCRPHPCNSIQRCVRHASHPPSDIGVLHFERPL